MKKIFLKLMILCSIFLIGLTSCSENFDLDDTVKILEKMRYDDITDYDTKEELENLNKQYNDFISYYGGKFKVNITRSVYMYRNYHYDKGECRIYEFETVTQAKQFHIFYINIRSDKSKFKYGIENNVVVVTNSKYVMKVIGFSFK